MAKLDINEEMVRKLAELLDETNLTEIEYSVGDQSIRVSRGGQPVMSTVTSAVPQAPAAAAPQTSDGPRPGAVTAPMPGVIYVAENPESPPLIKVGDTVAEGQTLMLIEAMKTFSQVRAPRAGRVVEILVSDRTPVEFGEELVILE
jgi:acetyl-CoA carboxylase biotin carboxyl carrier protein